MPSAETLKNWFETFKNTVSADSLEKIQFINGDSQYEKFNFGNIKSLDEVPLEKIAQLYNMSVESRLVIESAPDKVQMLDTDITLNTTLGPELSKCEGFDAYSVQYEQMLDNFKAHIVQNYQTRSTSKAPGSDARQADRKNNEISAAVLYLIDQAKKKQEPKSIAQILKEANVLQEKGIIHAATFVQPHDFPQKLIAGDEKALKQIDSWVDEYSKNLTPEEEFSKYCDKNQDPKQLQKAFNIFNRLWQINQCLKDADYSKGKTSQELYDISTNPKYENEYHLFENTVSEMEKKQKEAVDMGAKIKSVANMPRAIHRGYGYYFDFSGTQQAKEYNEKAVRMLQSQGPEADEFKKQFLINGINRALALDDEMLTPKTEQEAARLWTEHYHDYMILFDSEHMLFDLGDQFSIPKDIKDTLLHKSALYQENISKYQDLFPVKANPDFTALALLDGIDTDTISNMLNGEMQHALSNEDKMKVFNITLASGKNELKTLNENPVQPNGAKYDKKVLKSEDLVQTRILDYEAFNNKYAEEIRRLNLTIPGYNKLVDFTYAYQQSQQESALNPNDYIDDLIKNNKTPQQENEEILAWYQGFTEILKEKGILGPDNKPLNPMALGLIQVIDYPGKEAVDLAENGSSVKQIGFAMKTFSPAFIKRDRNGNPVPQKEDNYAEYLTKNTLTYPLKSDQMAYLYHMAREGRLCIQSDENAIGYVAPDLIIATEVGQAKTIKAADLKDLSYNKPVDRANELGINTSVLKNYLNLDLVCGGVPSIVSTQIDVLLTRKNDAVMNFAQNVQPFFGNRLICAEAKRHPQFYQNAADRRILNAVITTSTKAKLNYEGHLFDKNDKFINSTYSFADPLPLGCVDKLMNKLGANNLEELREKEIFDGNGKLIGGKTQLEYLNNLTNEFKKQHELYIRESIDDKIVFQPYRQDVAFKTAAKSTGVVTYRDQFNQCLKELEGYKSRFSHDTESYQRFELALVEYCNDLNRPDTPENPNPIRDGNPKNWPKPSDLVTNRQSFTNLVEAARAYQITHNNGKSLSTRQNNRLKVINKILALDLMAKNNDKFPVDMRKQLLTKLVIEKAGSMQSSWTKSTSQQGRDIMLNSQNFENECLRMQNDPAFKRLISKDSKELQKLLNSKSGKLFDNYTKIDKQIKAEPAKHKKVEEVKPVEKPIENSLV